MHATSSSTELEKHCSIVDVRSVYRALVHSQRRVPMARRGEYLVVDQELRGVACQQSRHSFLRPLDGAVPMVSADDVGRAAAALLQERWEGKRVVEP